jgi:hypothetical protein
MLKITNLHATVQILPLKGRWQAEPDGGVSLRQKARPLFETSPETVTPLRPASRATSPLRGGFFK